METRREHDLGKECRQRQQSFAGVERGPGRHPIPGAALGIEAEQHILAVEVGADFDGLGGLRRQCTAPAEATSATAGSPVEPDTAAVLAASDPSEVGGTEDVEFVIAGGAGVELAKSLPPGQRSPSSRLDVVATIGFSTAGAESTAGVSVAAILFFAVAVSRLVHRDNRRCYVGGSDRFDWGSGRRGVRHRATHRRQLQPRRRGGERRCR